jgi:hypothetical protein
MIIKSANEYTFSQVTVNPTGAVTTPYTSATFTPTVTVGSPFLSYAPLTVYTPGSYIVNTGLSVRLTLPPTTTFPELDASILVNGSFAAQLTRFVWVANTQNIDLLICSTASLILNSGDVITLSLNDSFGVPGFAITAPSWMQFIKL